MRRLLMAAAAATLGLVLTGSVQAHDRAYVSVSYEGPAYYREHGVRFSGGYYYPGREHCHWTKKVWSKRCGRYHYWDPCLHCYYYWCAPKCCYYPITYCP